MAKKKSIGNLISGIVGNVTESEMIAAKSGDISEVSAELREALEAKRKSKVGRPRKHTERRGITEEGCKANETRATFIVQKDQVRKIKYISLATTSLLKDVIASALGEYIEQWENEHGKITI